MTRTKARRKQEMKAALAYLGITRAAWCRTNEVDESHLNRFLNGERDSERLGAKVDVLVAEFRKKVVHNASASARVQDAA